MMLDTTRAPSQTCNQQDAAPAHERRQAPSGCRWCVLATKPHAERRAHAALHLKGFQPYLPLVTVRWRDHTWHTTPLFPGYLFCRLDLAKPWHPVTRAPGVFQLLMNGTQPATCPDQALEAVQNALHAAEAAGWQNDQWAPGARCTAILGGGIRVDGIVVTLRRQKAVLATVMLGELREITVDLDKLRLRP